MEQPTSGTVIELHYTLDCDDIVAFNLHHLSTSATVRRTRRQALVWTPFWVLVLMFLVFRDELTTGSISQILSVFISISFVLSLYLFLFPKYRHWHIQRYIRRAWSEGKNKSLVGKHTLKADEEALQMSSEYITARMSWKLVERVDVLDNYILLYISAFSAEIVPRSAFSTGSTMVEFLQLVGRRAGVPVKCPKCHYNLMGTQNGRCPECGYPAIKAS